MMNLMVVPVLHQTSLGQPGTLDWSHLVSLKKGNYNRMCGGDFSSV